RRARRRPCGSESHCLGFPFLSFCFLSFCFFNSLCLLSVLFGGPHSVFLLFSCVSVLQSCHFCATIVCVLCGCSAVHLPVFCLVLTIFWLPRLTGARRHFFAAPVRLTPAYNECPTGFSWFLFSCFVVTSVAKQGSSFLNALPAAVSRLCADCGLWLYAVAVFWTGSFPCISRPSGTYAKRWRPPSG
ncbi:unnamed protein product, partial [Phaeothamnion confervicola]